MAQAVSASASAPAIPSASSPALTPIVIPMPRIFGANPPSLKGHVDPTYSLPPAPVNDYNKIHRFKLSIDGCKTDILSLEAIKKELEKGGIDNNAQKLILVAQCCIQIINFKISRSQVSANIPENDAKAPLEYLNQALQALSTHRYEGYEKYHRINEILELYNQIESIDPINTRFSAEIADARVQCKLLIYTSTIEDTNELLKKGKFGEAVENVQILSELSQNPILGPEHHIAIIAILNAMKTQENEDFDKLISLDPVQQFANSAFKRIQGLKDVSQQVLMLKLLQEQASKVVVNHPDQKTILEPIHTNIKILLSTLKPHWYQSPKTITFVALGALAVFAAFLTAYRRWYRI